MSLDALISVRNDPYMDTCAQRIKAARKQAGYKSRREFARRLDVHEATVQRWERGEHPPDANNFRAIADATGVTVDWLQKGGEMRAVPVEPLYPTPLARFITETPEGRASSIAARKWLLQTVDLLPVLPKGLSFYRLLLAAYVSEPELSAADAAEAARFTKQFLGE